MRNFPKAFFSLNFLYLLLIAAQVAAIIFLCLYIPSFLPMAAAFAIIWLLTAIAACILFTRDGAAEVKCAWFVLIAALPVAGALIYLFATIKKKPHGVLKVNAPNARGIAGAANLTCGTCEAGYDRAQYFKDGAAFFTAALNEIESARKRVYLEFYIIGRGHFFTALLNALEKAKANGAEIKIILDGMGSAFRVNRKEFKKLKAAGAEVKIFHRLTPLPRAKLNFRDHRKIIAVDGNVAFTGGINFADEYANIGSPYGYWKDNGVAVYGEAAKIFEGMFLSEWNGSHEMDAPEGGKYKCLPYYDSPPYRTFCEDAYVYAINNATERVHILTPYFCLSGKTHAALSFAAKRGVDVKIIIPHIPDKKYAYAISKSYAAKLTKCGVKFYTYTPGFMHAKSLICDSRAFLGSYNFDYRSKHFNFECGVCFDGEIATEAERDFEECLALSAPLTAEKVLPHRRFCRFILKLFAPLI